MVRILLSEGSSVSAREAVAILGPLGHHIEVYDPSPWCLCRFSRYVRRVHLSPALGDDPQGYLRRLQELVATGRYDVLLPIHEHTLLLALAAPLLAPFIAFALPNYAAVARLQSKVQFVQLLSELDLPQPESVIVHSVQELRQVKIAYPYYVKTAFGTAGIGTFEVASNPDCERLIAGLEQRGALPSEEGLVVQARVAGVLEVAQGLFDHGRLIAVHCYRQLSVGVGGSASARAGVKRPAVLKHLARVGAALGWHGSLMLDYIYNEQGGDIAYIDPNPRPGETVNAALSGVNLVALLVRLSLGERLQSVGSSCAGVTSHVLLTTLLGLAERGSPRRVLGGELLRAMIGSGMYDGSTEECTPWRDDPPALIPLLAVSAQLLARPSNAQRIIQKTVARYALSTASVARIQAMERDI